MDELDTEVVRTVDLSPMTFDRVEWGDRQLVINPPLTLKPTMDEDTGRLYVLYLDELGIDVFARTREAVADELAEQLMFQWDAYALEALDLLTPSAQRLRETLLARMREVGNPIDCPMSLGVMHLDRIAVFKEW